MFGRAALCRRIVNRRRCSPSYGKGICCNIDGNRKNDCEGKNAYYAGGIAWISSCTSLWANLQVKVPPLGESITDGTVAAVLKQEGDQVEEDDPLIQIETDKVTVDVRTPVAGTVKSILVSPDDTVSVDHVVAVVMEGEAPGRVESKDGIQSAPKHQQAQKSKETLAPISEPSKKLEKRKVPPNNRAHVPLISFPSRRTMDGRMISDLSEAEQTQVRNDEITAMHSAAFFMKSMPQIEHVSLPPRKPLSEREMETIMLGGAD